MKRLLTGLLAALGLGWLILTATPLVSWWARWLGAGSSQQPRPVLVVLAGDTLTPNTLGYTTYLRCVYAFWFWQQHAPEEILLSGGPPRHPTAALMADFLAGLGVPRDRMRLETASTDTRGNLAGVARMLRGDRRPIILITSDFHMSRALRLARRDGLEPEPLSVPDVGKRSAADPWERPGLAVILAQETGKLAFETVWDWFHSPSRN